MRFAFRHRSSRPAAVAVALSLTAGLPLGLVDSASAAVTAGPISNKPTGTGAGSR
ncbi:hypothetical protein AB0I77_01590 [Streptomyces sp. NPDC050619]|uniref:hypothetical protein n=1 Tax=Streptomyces sp. NPDC050619 TaxID=3157214 RepID=UPI00341CD182